MNTEAEGESVSSYLLAVSFAALHLVPRLRRYPGLLQEWGSTVPRTVPLRSIRRLPALRHRTSISWGILDKVGGDTKVLQRGQPPSVLLCLYLVAGVLAKLPGFRPLAIGAELRPRWHYTIATGRISFLKLVAPITAAVDLIKMPFQRLHVLVRIAACDGARATWPSHAVLLARLVGRDGGQHIGLLHLGQQDGGGSNRRDSGRRILLAKAV